jgi:tetratricopeptide (TPR) repeat protein
MRITFKMAVLATAFFFSYGLMLSSPAAATLLALQAGMEGPEFSLKTLDGKSVPSSELKGDKLTIILFWSTWSSKSEKLLARMQKLFEKYRGQGLAVIGINVDEQNITRQTLTDIAELKNKLKIGYPMLVDHSLTVFHDYGVIALPTTVIMDKERQILYELSGYPLVGSETMLDFVVSAMEGKKPAMAAEKKRYRPNRTAMRFYNMGKTTLKSKRMADNADLWFKKASEADPDFVLPYLSLGMMYLQKGNTSMAQAEFRKALDREPNNPIALCESGMILINEGKTAEGTNLFEAARKAEESYAPCYYYAGYAYGKAGKLDEAMKLFDEAEQVNPSDYNIFVYKGRLFEAQKNVKKAADAYKNALEKILAAELKRF